MIGSPLDIFKGVLTMRVRQFSIGRWQTVLAAAVALAFIAPFNAHAQTYTVLHTFTSGVDGATPYAGLALDGAGNFYGTASQGGYTGAICYGLFGQQVNGCGTVFRLHRSGSNWTFSTLYEFRGGTADGNFPLAAVTIGRDGSLYGTTWGGHYNGSINCEFSGNPPPQIGCGTVFNLRPPASACTTALCSWIETIIWALDGTNQGGAPVPAKARRFSIKPAIFTSPIGIH